MRTVPEKKRGGGHASAAVQHHTSVIASQLTASPINSNNCCRSKYYADCLWRFFFTRLLLPVYIHMREHIQNQNTLQKTKIGVSCYLCTFVCAHHVVSVG